MSVISTGHSEVIHVRNNHRGVTKSTTTSQCPVLETSICPERARERMIALEEVFNENEYIPRHETLVLTDHDMCCLANTAMSSDITSITLPFADVHRVCHGQRGDHVASRPGPYPPHTDGCYQRYVLPPSPLATAHRSILERANISVFIEWQRQAANPGEQGNHTLLNP